ncbi:unnamed protein product [Echinostoma caproni]|uniref:MFS domain-containing protein n=1 Tax=Echinostoma caproni TaxID=27848 RepID=A0A183AFI0_9TREM|nr:unnamed protein product [Echinostoma caproni]
MCYPSLHRLVSHWFPPREYAFLAGVMHSGYIVGTVLALLCSGFLIDSPFHGGWPLPFYVSGALAFIWLPTWIFLVSETPKTHSYITMGEKRYIEDSLKHTENGALSALPYIAALVFMFLLTPIDSLLINRGLLSIPRARKLWSAISAFGKSILLLTIAYSPPNHRGLIVVLLVINVALSSLMLIGFNLADLDLAPPYAGFLFAIFNACSTLSGMLAPLIVGAFTNIYPAEVAWRNVFILASAVSCLCGVLYVLFGRAELLDWVLNQHANRPDILYHPLEQGNSTDSWDQTLEEIPVDPNEPHYSSKIC